MEMLISICVISYNSQETIIETLDSIREQTYKNIELIISDDASKDNTVKIVKDWINDYKDRFHNIVLLTVDENSGVPSNCNRALSVCGGEWVKFIAADDCLLPRCIEDNINYINNKNDIKILCTNYSEFTTDQDNNRIIVRNQFSEKFRRNFDVCPKKQLKIYMKYSCNITPSAFVKLDLYRELNGFDEKYKLFEDTPFFTKVLLYDIKIYVSPLYTVLYRINNNSITHSTNDLYFYRKEFMDYFYQFRSDVIYKQYRWYELGFWIQEISNKILYLFCIHILNNNKNKFNKILYYIFKSLNPYFWALTIKLRTKKFLKLKL